MAYEWLDTRSKRSWAGVIVLAVAVMCVYWPVLSHQYLYYDDWIVFSGHGSSCAHSPMYEWSWMSGRILDAYSLCGLFDVFDKTADAWRGRLIVIGAIIAFAVLQWFYFRAAGVDWLAAVCFALGTSLLPGMLVLGYWLTAGSIVFALIASVTAALLTQTAVSSGGKVAKKAALIAGACGFQVVALLIYQTHGMYFWTLTAVMLAIEIRNGVRAIVRPLAIYIFVGFVPMVGYYIWFTRISGYAEVLKRHDPLRGTMFTDLSGKARGLLEWVLPRAASLWFIDLPNSLGTIILAAWSICVILHLVQLLRHYRQQEDRRSAKLFLLYPVILASLGLLSFSPMLVTAYGTLTYRSMIPLSAFLFVIGAIHLGVVARIETWPVMVRIGLATCFGLGVSSLASSSLMSRMVLPAAAEYSFVRNSMTEVAHLEPAPRKAQAVVPLVRQQLLTDEFGGPSSRSGQVLAPMVQIMASEKGLQLGTVPFSLPGEPFEKEGILVLDFAQLSKSGMWGAVSAGGAGDSQPHVLLNRGDYVLSEYRGRIYALPNSAGLVTEASSAILMPGVISGRTINDVLSQLPPGSDSASQPQFLRFHEDRSLVAFRGHFYAVPVKLGKLSLSDWSSGKVDELPGVIIGPTLGEVISRISQPVAQDSPPKLLQAHQRYNLVSFRGRIYGVPWAAGVLNLEDWTSGKVDKLPGVVIGASIDEVISRLPK